MTFTSRGASADPGLIGPLGGAADPAHAAAVAKARPTESSGRSGVEVVTDIDSSARGRCPSAFESRAPRARCVRDSRPAVLDTEHPQAAQCAPSPGKVVACAGLAVERVQAARRAPDRGPPGGG